MLVTITVLIGGLALSLLGLGLLGTLLGVRATLEHFADGMIGAIMAGYYAGYIIGTHLGPVVIHRVGHIRAFAAMAALTAASTLGFGLAPDPLAWLPLRVLNGLAVVGLYMVVESWLNSQAPADRRGRIFALYMLSTLGALAIGQPLLLVYPPAGLEPFALAAILIVLGLVPITLVRVREPVLELPTPLPLAQLFRLSPLGSAGAFGAGMVNGIFWGLTPVFASRIELDSAAIASLMSATIVGGALLQWPIGRLSDRRDRRSVLILVSFCAAGMALAASWVVLQRLPGLMPVAFLYGGLMFSIYAIAVAHTNDQIAGHQVLGATRGLLLLYGLGALSGPLGGGLAMAGFGPVGLPALSAAVLAGIGLYGIYRSRQRAAVPVDEQTEFVPLVRTTPVALEMHPLAAVEGNEQPPAASS